MEHLQEKTSCAKLHSTSKRRVFLQEQAKSHGNADAYRGFLTNYWGKTPFLKRVTPLWIAAFEATLFLLSADKQTYSNRFSRRHVRREKHISRSARASKASAQSEVKKINGSCRSR